MNFLQSIFTTTETTSSVTTGSFFLCLAVSLVLGFVITGGFMFRNRYSKSFAATLVLLPAIVQIIIMMVNGNIGTGIAVMGAFSLIRFRSAQGSAREICSIFLAMAVGLATGMGYLWLAVIFTVIVVAAGIILDLVKFGEGKDEEMTLRITIPEELNYTEVFEAIFAEYAKNCKLVQVKTTNMGSLFKLEYRMVLKDRTRQKEMMDAIRCRNGNLEVLCSYSQTPDGVQAL